MTTRNAFVITPTWQTLVNAVAVLFTAHAVYILLQGETLLWLCLAFAVYSLFNISVTAGFHQLFTHRSYKCSKVWEIIFAVCGTLAFQGSVVSWVHLHYVHHNTADTQQDPHNRSLWFFLFKKYNSVVMHPSKTVVRLLKNPAQHFLHFYGGLACILFATALYLIDYKLFLFGYMVPVAYFYFGVSCHQIFTHVGGVPRNVPFFFLLFPWADWNHAEHHKNPNSLTDGGWCLSYEFIKLIKQ
jgi:fatty-acid desaturase